MKKIVALVLCLVMVVGLMAGCQKKMDADTLYQKMNEAVKSVTAQAMDAEMDLEMKISTMGITMNIVMGLDLGIQAKSDYSTMHMDMDMTMEAMGETQEISAEVYTAQEGDSLVSYVYESESDMWVKSVEEGYQELMTQVQELVKEMGLEEGQLPKGTLTLANDQITVNGRKCYELTQQIGSQELESFMADYMDKLLTMAMEESGEEIDGETQQVLDMFKELDWSKLSYNVVYHVDAETFLPLENTLEILGLGETMNGMIETIMAAAMMEMDEETPAFSVEIPTLKLVMTNMAYNDDVQIPAVPQEAIDNAIDASEMEDEELVDGEDVLGENLPQADGSYLLSMGTNSVRVVVPEGYPYAEAGSDYLYAMSEDGSVFLTYYLDSTINDAEVKSNILSDVDWAKENDYYKSHSDVSELEGFSTASLIYNDDTSVWYGWKELDGCTLLVCAEVEGEVCDMAALIANVSIVE